MSLDLNDEKSTLVQVMAWCHQATSHYLSQCWPRSLSPYGVTRPQWVNPPVSPTYSPSSRPLQSNPPPRPCCCGTHGCRQPGHTVCWSRPHWWGLRDDLRWGLRYRGGWGGVGTGESLHLDEVAIRLQLISRTQLQVDTRSSHWLSGKLWYLQQNCVGDTIVYH